MKSISFVLVHGAYCGGWSWKKVVAPLRESAMRVVTPTLAGLAERNNLLSNFLNLSMHISNISGILRMENLHDVILVGHSYSGMVISGVAESEPDRIARMVYLDAVLPKNGQAMFDIMSGSKARATDIMVGGQTVKVIAPPSAEVLCVTDAEDIKWMNSQMTPMPYNCYSEPIKLGNPRAASIKKTYLLSEIQQPGESQAAHEDAYERAQGPNWSRRKIPGGHCPMITHPKELVEVFREIQRST